MDFNWQKGLVGMASGALSGYTSILSKKAEADLESKKQDAMLQREKSMAKYNQGLKQETWEKQQGYLLDQEKRKKGSTFMLGDRELTMGELEAMSPEEKAGLKSKSDYLIDLKQREAESTYRTQQDLQKKTLEGKVDATISSMAEQLSLSEEDQTLLREVMINEEITKPSQLKALLSQTKKGLGEETLRMKEKEAKEAFKDMVDLDANDENTFIQYAEKFGATPKDGEDARKFLINNQDKIVNKLYETSILRIAAGQSKTPTVIGELPSQKAAKAEKIQTQISNLAEEVKRGNVTMEEVKAKVPAEIYKKIEDMTAESRGTWKSVLPIKTKKQIRTEQEAEDLRKGKVIEEGMNLGFPSLLGR